MNSSSKIVVTFGKVIKQRRNQLRISQEKLAELAGLHRTYISQIERGIKTPSLKSVVAIANGLSIKPHELLLMIEKNLNDNNNYI